MGPGFRFSKERNTFIANVYYQRSALDGQIVRDDAEKIKHAYNNVTYFMMGQLNINRENSLRLFVSSYTDSPSITDLQSVYDVSDAQNISHGNPNLKPTYSHRVNFHYTNSNVEKGRTFMWMFSMNTTLDYTAQHLVQRPGDITIDGQAYSPNFYSTTENLDGYWQLRTHLSYGLPIGFLKSNFNVMAGVIYTKTPSMLGGTVDAATGMISGGERNDTKNMGYDFRAVLGSNISENVDFTLSWNGTYNEATNSLNADKSKNRYFNHTAQGNLKVVFPLGFTFTASAAYSQYIGFTNDYSEDYLLCNVWLGKKVFKNKRGEVMVGVNDLFNQNRAFALDGFGLHAELDQQRHRPLLYGAVQLQPAPFRQEGFAQYKGLRRCRVLLRFPPHGTRRAGRTSSGDVPRTAVNRSRAGLSRLTRAISVNLLFSGFRQRK